MTLEQLEEAKLIEDKLKRVEKELETVTNHFNLLKEVENSHNIFTVCATNRGSFNLGYNEEYKYNYKVFLALQEKTLVNLKLKLEKEFKEL